MIETKEITVQAINNLFLYIVTYTEWPEQGLCNTLAEMEPGLLFNNSRLDHRGFKSHGESHWSLSTLD